MHKKEIVLIALLIVLAQGLAYSSGRRVSEHYQDTRTGQSSNPAARNATRTKQSGLFIQCGNAVELARKHLHELGRAVTHSPVRANEIQRHLRESQSAVSSMLDDHHRFVYTLTEEQWNTTNDSITVLEQLRAAISARLEGFDDELQMPTPDAKVLTRYVKKTDRLLQEWQKQHRSMGGVLGIRNR
jgi:hypothetical protein